MHLAYYFWGSEKNTALPLKTFPQRLVLLHGMGGTGALWRPLAAALENDWRILAPDQRGHGKSSIAQATGARDTPRFTPLDYGRDVIDTLDQLDFHPTWVLGHSMGVRTACAAAHLKPEWIQGLILIDLGFSGVAGGGLGDGLAGFLKILPDTFQSRDEARAFMKGNCPDPAIAQYLMAVSQKSDVGLITFPFDRGALIQTIEAARDVSVRTWVKDLARNGLPILVLRGAQSLVWSHEEFEKEKGFFKDYPSIIFKEIEGTGHGLPFEKRLLLVEEIKKLAKSDKKV